MRLLRMTEEERDVRLQVPHTRSTLFIAGTELLPELFFTTMSFSSAFAARPRTLGARLREGVRFPASRSAALRSALGIDQRSMRRASVTYSFMNTFSLIDSGCRTAGSSMLAQPWCSGFRLPRGRAARTRSRRNALHRRRRDIVGNVADHEEPGERETSAERAHGERLSGGRVLRRNRSRGRRIRSRRSRAQGVHR